MFLTHFTLLHVAIRLAGIGAGLVVVYGLRASKRLDGRTAAFLATTVATSVAGFLFPFHRLLPSHAVGIASLLVLPVAIYGRCGRHLAGSWRLTNVVTAMIALHLNVFVLIVQAFLKVPPLKALAPTQSEPPFALTQGVILALFVLLTVIAVTRFRAEQPRQDRLSVQPA